MTAFQHYAEKATDAELRAAFEAHGRVVAAEVMVVTPAIRDLILEAYQEHEERAAIAI